MNGIRTVRAACILALGAMPASANQQEIYPPSAMPRVDAHTHMDARDQYARAVADMDTWGGTLSISLAGLFWVKDNDGKPATPDSGKKIPGNDMMCVKKGLNDRILDEAPGRRTAARSARDTPGITRRPT